MNRRVVGDNPGPQRVVGRYLLCDEIAAGGMATVHIGRLQGSAGFARTVAIKRLHAQFAKDPDFLAMFLDEARIASRIGHPNVVATIDVVATDGELFIAMEYVNGEALHRLVNACHARTGQGVPPSIALSIISGALYGLHAAHEVRDDQGAPLDIVHRDVSPQNILVGQDGVPRIVDFGVAKATGRLQMTREGVLKGKLAYMSPEQIACEGVDRRTDIYAASVVLWEMLTGQRLFAAENDAGVLRAVLAGAVEPPSSRAPWLSPAIDALVLKGLSRDRSRRFATAWEMAEAAQQLGHATPGQIGTWVRSLAGPSLDQRASRVAEIESSSRQPQGDANKKLGNVRTTQMLAPAPLKTMLMPAPAASPQGREAPTSQVSAFNLTPLPSPPRRSRLPLVAALAVPLVLVITLSGLLRRSLVSTEPATPAAAGPSATGSVAPTAPVSAEPPAAATTSSASATAASSPTNAPAPPADPHAAAKSATAPAARAPVKPSCTPPYTIDSAGVRVPKLECL